MTLMSTGVTILPALFKRFLWRKRPYADGRARKFSPDGGVSLLNCWQDHQH
jgi:hypothetical protein